MVCSRSPTYLDAQGTLGIGSDSHISVSPVEELRWLEYGQRLSTRHRNIAARHQGDSVGETVWRAALRGGALASGLPIGELREGARADLFVLDDRAPLLAARDERSVIDSFLFAGNVPLVRDVMVGGEWVVRHFMHSRRGAHRRALSLRHGALGAALTRKLSVRLNGGCEMHEPQPSCSHDFVIGSLRLAFSVANTHQGEHPCVDSC